MPELPRKPSEAEQRAAVPAATQAAKAAEVAAETAQAAAVDVSPAVARAADRLEEAAETLVDDLKDAADDLKSTSRTRLCPHCKGELVKHGDENPHKAGAYHCNNCGTCWAPGLRAPMPGSTAPAGWGA